MLFEDEEDTGLSRERQFKWKNIDSSLKDDTDRSTMDTETKEVIDDTEEEWRKMRHEREQLLEQSEPLDVSNQTNAAESLTIINNSTPNPITKKITIIKSSKNTVQNATLNSPFLIAKSKVQVTIFS